ncbi:MAG: O-antigen ligase family protein [Candidatus Wallbacteria bacterium]
MRPESLLFFIVPLFTPIIFLKYSQDAFLFPKEIFLISAAGLIFFEHAWLRYYKIQEPSRFKIQFHLSDYIYAFLVVLCALSLYRAPSFYVPIQSVVLILSLCLIYYKIKFDLTVYNLYGKYMSIFAFSSLAAVIYAYFQYYRLDFIFMSSYSLDKMRLFSFFGNKNYFSEYLCILTFILISKIIILDFTGRSLKNSGLKPKLSLFYTASLTLTILMIYILQSRSSLIAVMTAGIIFTYYIFKNRYILAAIKAKAGRYLIIASIISALFVIYSTNTPVTNEKTNFPERISSVFNISGERNIAMRLDIWHATYRIIKDNFWFGCGLSYFKMNFLNYQAVLFKENLNRFYENQFFAKANQAHNEYLQIFCELGIFGISAIIILVAYYIILFLRLLALFSKSNSGSSKYIIILSLFCAFWTVLVNSLFGFPLHIAPTAVLLIFVIALIEKIAINANAGSPILTFQREYAVDFKRPNIKLIHVVISVFYFMIFFILPQYVNSNIKMKQGLDLLKLSRPASAVSYLEKSIKINPIDGETHYYAGVAYFQTHEYEKAVFAFLRALETQSDPNIYAYAGLALYRLKIYDKALEFLKMALEISPDDMYFLLNAGCAEQCLKNYGSALNYFQKAIKLASTPEAYVNLGHVYLLMNMPDFSLNILREAMNKFNPKPEIAEKIYFISGLSYGEKKEYETAAVYIKKAINIGGNKRDYAINLGIFQIFSGKTSEAEVTLKNLLKNDFDELAAYNLSNLYFNSGSTGKAYDILIKIKARLESENSTNSPLYIETNRLIKSCLELKYK